MDFEIQESTNTGCIFQSWGSLSFLDWQIQQLTINRLVGNSDACTQSVDGSTGLSPALIYLVSFNQFNPVVSGKRHSFVCTCISTGWHDFLRAGHFLHFPIITSNSQDSNGWSSTKKDPSQENNRLPQLKQQQQNLRKRLDKLSLNGYWGPYSIDVNCHSAEAQGGVSCKPYSQPTKEDVKICFALPYFHYNANIRMFKLVAIKPVDYWTNQIVSSRYPCTIPKRSHLLAYATQHRTDFTSRPCELLFLPMSFDRSDPDRSFFIVVAAA